MIEIITNFLYKVFDFFYQSFPEIPTIPNLTFDALIQVNSFINYISNGSVVFLTLVSISFILLIANLLFTAMKFVYRSIPMNG